MPLTPRRANAKRWRRPSSVGRAPRDRATSAFDACAHVLRDNRVSRRTGENRRDLDRAPRVPPTKTHRRTVTAVAAGPVLRPSRRLPEAAVAETARAIKRRDEHREHRCGDEKGEEPRLCHSCHLLSSLEPDILESLCRAAIEVRCKPVVAAPGREVAPCDPGGCAMARRPELLEAGLRRREGHFGLVDAALLEQRATEHELRASDLVDVILVSGGLEEAECVPCLLLSLVDAAGAKVNLRHRGHCLRDRKSTRLNS